VSPPLSIEKLCSQRDPSRNGCNLGLSTVPPWQMFRGVSRGPSSTEELHPYWDLAVGPTIRPPLLRYQRPNACESRKCDASRRSTILALIPAFAIPDLIFSRSHLRLLPLEGKLTLLKNPEILGRLLALRQTIVNLLFEIKTVFRDVFQIPATSK
jgi:hypothetical protein